MGDLIPKQCITLRMAYDRFALWGGEAPVQHLHSLDLSNAPHPSVADQIRRLVTGLADTMLAEFLRVFINGELEACVRQPGLAADYSIPPEAWSEAFFPERAFLADEIVTGVGGYFDDLAARTPFVRLAEFEPWLAKVVEQRAGPDSRRSPTVCALVDLLIGIAADGIASSTTVESWAKKWGLPPLATKPPRGAFEPTQLADWSLPMTVSWIVWRDLDRVREANEEYRAECLEWFGCTYRAPAPGGIKSYEVHGEELKSPRPLTLSTLMMLEAIDESFPDMAESTVRDARSALWKLCGEGKLRASAVAADGNVSVIPEHEWSRLEVATSRRGDDYLVWSHDSMNVAYKELRFPRAAILKLWPPKQCDSPVEEAVEIPTPAVGPKVLATLEAIRHLHSDGVPVGLVRKTLLTNVNRYLENRGSSRVEMSTLRRALNILEG